MKTTFSTLLAMACIFSLSPSAQALDGFNEIKGSTTNYVITNSDGLIDASIVVTGLSAQDLMSFDITKVLSPVNDTVSVLTKSFDIPSNISLPKQTDSYFLSFTLDKPQFRFYVPADGTYNVYALRGQFPLDDLVDGVQNDMSIFELINYFTFYGAGTKNVKVEAAAANVNVAVNEITFNSSFNVKAPAYEAGKVLVSLGLFKNGDEYFPTDIKKIAAGATQKMISRSGSNSYHLGVIMNDTQSVFVEDFDGDITRAALKSRAGVELAQLSYHLQKASNNALTPSFLPMIAAPKFNKNGAKVTATAPKTISGVKAYATTFILSQVAEGGSADFAMDVKTELFSTTVSGWKNEFAVPADVMKLIKTKKYSWDVLYLGAAAESNDEPKWDNVTHVTRNVVKF